MREQYCDGKKVYLTFGHAHHDAGEVRAKHDESASQVYSCRTCQGWHVGNRTVARMRRPRPLPPAYDLEDLDS